MSFFKEIAGKVGSHALGGYNLINFNGEHVYVEGIDRLLGISPERIEMKIGKRVLAVTGTELEVSELEKGSVTISGRIEGESIVEA